MIDTVPLTSCYKCGKAQNLTKHSTYTLKGGEVRTQYICRACNTAKVRARRGTRLAPTTPLKAYSPPHAGITIEYTEKVYNKITGEWEYPREAYE